MFVAASLYCLGYLLFNYRAIVTRAGVLTSADVVVGAMVDAVGLHGGVRVRFGG